MMLLTQAIKKALPAFYSTDGIPLEERKVAVKFFCPWNNWTWFVFEGEKQEDGDYLFFGMVHGFEKELGNFLLSELESATSSLGLKIERDRHYKGVYKG